MYTLKGCFWVHFVFLMTFDVVHLTYFFFKNTLFLPIYVGVTAKTVVKFGHNDEKRRLDTTMEAVWTSNARFDAFLKQFIPLSESDQVHDSLSFVFEDPAAFVEGQLLLDSQQRVKFGLGPNRDQAA